VFRHKRSVLLLFSTLCAFACTSKEDQARAFYNAALTAERNANYSEQERLLRLIANNFPTTTVATDANKDLERVEARNRSMILNVVDLLRMIGTQQVIYFQKHSRYAANLTELVGSAEVFKNSPLRYNFSTLPTGTTYAAMADPVDMTGYHLFVDGNEGIIRYEIGKPAFSGSPEFNDNIFVKQIR